MGAMAPKPINRAQRKKGNEEKMKYRAFLKAKTKTLVGGVKEHFSTDFIERQSAARWLEVIVDENKRAGRDIGETGIIEIENESLINLSTPVRREKRRSFQPPWYTVFIYLCKSCKKETTVRAGSFIGGRPIPSVGAIVCPHCEFSEKYPTN